MRLRCSLYLFLLLTAFPAGAAQDKVAVVVYGQDEVASRYQRVAQTRFEQLLADNGVVVLDQDKAEELKDTWGRLSDPGALITAEDFVENAGKYEISGIYRIYLSAGKAVGLAATFTATASADIRFVDAEAQVKAAASAPMGTKGMPPSDGLTESAALNNAIQRAVDHSAGKIGMQVMDVTHPRLVRLALKQVEMLPEDAAAVPATPALGMASEWAGYARLQADDWTSEEPTCVRASPDGRMGVVGTYLMRTSFNFGRPTRAYASYLHVVDADTRGEVERFEVSVKDPRYQRGGSRITDCLFLRSWRYVAAVSQSHLIFADTERGVELGRHYFSEPFDKPALAHLHGKTDDFLSVTEGARRALFQIVRE